MKELYLFLNDGNEFPSWFKSDLASKDLLKIHKKYHKKGTNIFNFKKRRFVGEDDNYKFYLKEIAFTPASIEDKFIVALKIKCSLKENIRAKNYLKKITLFYDVLAPLWI